MAEAVSLPERGTGPVKRVHDGTESHVNATSHNWAGAVLHIGADDRFDGISGSWTVPEVEPTPGAKATTSCWVGLDGDGVTPGLVQAGTDSSEDGSCMVWCEWFPAPAQAVDMEIEPGDVFSAELYVPTPTEVRFELCNVTRGLHKSASITAPAEHGILGITAEAIIERPILGHTVPLARFDSVAFSGVVARSMAGRDWPITLGSPLTMVDDNERPIATCELLAGGGDEMVVRYAGSLGDVMEYSSAAWEQAMDLIVEQAKAPSGANAPYKIQSAGKGRWKVVNNLGETKATFDSREKALTYLRALYANVPGASKRADKVKFSGKGKQRIPKGKGD